jgi:hypothetical protein
LLLIALCLLQAGCAVIAVGAGMLAAGAAEEAAMRPYDRALRHGRMNAIEYARQRSATERSVDALFSPCPPRPP